MGMKINAELPLPANLKAEYPLPKELAEIKKKILKTVDNRGIS